MPELPEVQTTVDGLNKKVLGKQIVDVRTTYNSLYHRGKDNIKDPKFFTLFRKIVRGQKIIKIERRAKNILIGLSNSYTVIVHMKMTGYFAYDRPLTKFVRLDFKLDNNKHLVLSDMRKFAKVTLMRTDELEKSPHIKALGPEPLDKNFQYAEFKSQILKRPSGKIKQVLVDQSLIAGIGNIYSDEILWSSGVHPLSRTNHIPKKKLLKMFTAMKELLKQGIEFGGDSTSDYRNIEGEKGNFQNQHKAYHQTGRVCLKKKCDGVIKRLVVGARSAHFCPVHQELFADR